MKIRSGRKERNVLQQTHGVRAPVIVLHCGDEPLTAAAFNGRKNERSSSTRWGQVTSSPSKPSFTSDSGLTSRAIPKCWSLSRNEDEVRF